MHDTAHVVRLPAPLPQQYMFCFGVLMIGEAMMAIYFLLPSARAKIVASLGAEKVKATVEAHILVAGYCVLGIVAIQVRRRGAEVCVCFVAN